MERVAAAKQLVENHYRSPPHHRGDASVNIHTQEKYPSSRALSLQAESNGDLRKSSSSDTIWASGSDSSSGRYTPKANGFLIQNIHQESSNILSPHCNYRTSCAPRTNSADSDADFKELGESNAGWCINSAAEGCVRGSTNSIGDSSWREIFQDPDATIENLRGHALTLSRQLEIAAVDPDIVDPSSERKQGSVETTTENDDEEQHYDDGQYELEELIKEHDELKIENSGEQPMVDLKGVNVAYSKDREDIEMQMNSLLWTMRFSNRTTMISHRGWSKCN